jgi:hypothetical protein
VRKEAIQSKRRLKESRKDKNSASHGRRNISINILKPRKRIRKKFLSLNMAPTTTSRSSKRHYRKLPSRTMAIWEN